MHGNDGLRRLLDQLLAEGRECEWLEFNVYRREKLFSCHSLRTEKVQRDEQRGKG